MLHHKFKKFWKTFMQEQVSFKNQYLKFCPKFDVKVGKVNFDLKLYNKVQKGVVKSHPGIQNR